MRDDVEFTIQAFVTNKWFKIDWFDKEIPHVKLLDIVTIIHHIVIFLYLYSKIISISDWFIYIFVAILYIYIRVLFVHILGLFIFSVYL